MASEAREWVSSAEASKRLRVSKKTIWRRARAGTLEARKVPGDNGGFEWEISFDASDQADTTERTGTGQGATQSDISRSKPSVQSEGTGDQPSGHRDSDERLISHLEKENTFLRAVVEQLQRDGAETRAALREALKGRAKELTTGTPTAAPEAASVAQEAPQVAQTGKDTRRAPEPQIARTGNDGSMTLGDIADFLEKELNQQ